jgi:predicted metalloprotease
MLWQGRRESENVEDARGSAGRRLVVGGGIGTIVLVVIYLLLGGDPQALFNSQQGAQLSLPEQVGNQAPNDEASKFVAVARAWPTIDVLSRLVSQLRKGAWLPRSFTLLNYRLSTLLS